MFDSLFGLFSYDLGIDLGTANTMVLVRNQGIKIRQPSVIALNKQTGNIIAVGTKAQQMIGKTPPDILAILPLENGVISDFEAVVKMITFYIKKIHAEKNIASLLGPKPRVIVGIPSEVTEVERRAVSKAILTAGARQCFLIDEPMAAAIGAGLKISSPVGSLIIDIGGGTTEIALISLGGIVAGKSLRKAGRSMDQNIVDYAKKECRLVIGQGSAEKAKIAAGAAITNWKGDRKDLKYLISGREISSGLPRAVELTSDEIAKALKPTLQSISRAIIDILEEAPPELVADIQKKGMLLAGGGSLLRGMVELLKKKIGVGVALAEDPQTCVVRGCGHLLENKELLKRVT
jgi:rod shape-determining protein MreB